MLSNRNLQESLINLFKSYDSKKIKQLIIVKNISLENTLSFVITKKLNSLYIKKQLGFSFNNQELEIMGEIVQLNMGNLHLDFGDLVKKNVLFDFLFSYDFLFEVSTENILNELYLN